MKKIGILIIALVLFTGFASAQSQNETQQALQQAQENIEVMEEQEIPTERVENLLETANNSYLAQRNFAREGGTADYSRALELTQQISEIQESAIRVSDRIDALDMRINELEDTNVNLTQAKSDLESAQEDFQSQRFEEADQHVGEGYSSISEAQSARTQLESFAAAQQEDISARISTAIDYIRSNSAEVGTGTFVSLLVFLFTFKEFHTYRLIKARRKKRIKEDVLEKLITDIQKEYYMKKKGSSIQFETKLDKFEDLRRDVVEDIEVIDTKLENRRSLIWSTEEHLESEDQLDEAAPEEELGSEKQAESNQTEEPQEQDEIVEVVEDSDENDEDEDKELEFECPTCDEGFRTKRGLYIHHKQMHEDEEDVECPLCGKAFDSVRGMHIHRGKVHEN